MLAQHIQKQKILILLVITRVEMERANGERHCGIVLNTTETALNPMDINNGSPQVLVGNELNPLDAILTGLTRKPKHTTDPDEHEMSDSDFSVYTITSSKDYMIQ